MNLNDTLQCINRSVRGLEPYHLNPENVSVKLNQNESPFDWPESIKRQIADFCLKRPWNRYPDFIPEDLKRALAGYIGVSSNQIIVGNGSNEILLTLLLSAGSAARTVFICKPCFTVYSILVRGLAFDEKTIFLNDDLTYNVDTVCGALSENPGSLLITCSPNSPTGTALSEIDLRRILEAHKGIFILDQAYVEFGGFDALPLCAEYPNLIITRTFSKAFGGAGLRLGYAIGNPDIITEINKIKLPYNINFFSSQVAAVLLSSLDVVEKNVSYIVAQRKPLFDFLRSLPFDNVYESKANFILVRTKKKEALFEHLRKNSILVRDVSNYPMLENCLRIGIGTVDETEALKTGLADFFRKVNK